MNPWLAVVLRPSAVLAVALLLTTALRHRSAALRHWILLVGVLLAAAVLPLSGILQAWKVALPVPLSMPVAPPPTTRLHTTAASVQAVTTAADRALPSIPALVWLAGALVAASLRVAGIARLRRLVARAAPIDDDRWTRAADEISRAYRLPRKIAVLQTDSPHLLATWGWRHPVVLLPSHARDWPSGRIRVVLSHEFAHVRRGDWLVQMGAELARALFWFNPLMWLACARLRQESERACDDAVLRHGVEAKEYAAHLLALARLCRRLEPSAMPAVRMAHPSTPERRIVAMLNPRLDRCAPSTRALVSTASLILVVALSSAALVARQLAPAALSGSVYDSTGGVLPEVMLTLEDAAGHVQPVVSDAAGGFTFPGVPPGRYLIEASIAGFRPLRTEFELRNTRDWDRAITLQVGQVSETINVTAARTAAPPPPSQPQGPRRLRVGGNIRTPRKELDVRPVYPPAMRAAGREGLVPIEAIIGADGSVTSVRVLSAQVHPDFAIAAVDAVRQWRFTPTLLNGAPVDIVMTVTVSFSLSE